MKPIANKKFSFLMTNELYWSEAYQSLTKSARNLLWCMVAELRFTGKRGSKDKPFSYTNNGNISFTETEFKKQGLGVSETYLRARNLLIEVGFIEVTYRGGFARGDMNTYRLLFIDGVHQLDRKWKKYPKENWRKDIPKVKDNTIGKKNRFKKKNNTLKKSTLNGTNLPTKVDPYSETSLADKGVSDDLEGNKTPV